MRLSLRTRVSEQTAVRCPSTEMSLPLVGCAALAFESRYVCEFTERRSLTRRVRGVGVPILYRFCTVDLDDVHAGEMRQ
jgi:hypothetical protein